MTDQQERPPIVGLTEREANEQLDGRHDQYMDRAWCFHALTGLGYPTLEAKILQRAIFSDWGVKCATIFP